MLIPSDYLGNPANLDQDFGMGDTVEITTLESLVDAFGLNDAILKMNCEGCE